MRRLLPIFLLLCPMLMGSDLRRAEKSLRTGRYLLASQMFREMLKESPEFHVAELGLARSQVAMGRCEQAMARLERIRKTPSWSHHGAAVEGLCHLRSGRPEHAVVAFEESLLFDPDHPLGWYGLYQANVQLKSEAEASRAVNALENLKDAEVLALMASLDRLQRSATLDLDMEQTLAAWAYRDIGRAVARRQSAQMEAKRWMDLGHPQQAIRVLEPVWLSFRANIQLSALLAEAYRRVGELDSARGVLEHTLVKVSQHPVVLGVRVRLAFDERKLDSERASLQRLRTLENPETWATEWYVSRNTDHKRASKAKARWLESNSVQDRQLADLEPWGSLP